MFRPEAIAHQQDRLQGDALRLGGGPLRLLSIAAACALALAILAFGVLGHYTRKEHVTGYLAPSAGLIKVYTPQTATVVQSLVAEGQAVRRGDLLLVLESQRATTGVRDAQAAMRREIEQRRDSLQRERAKQAEIDELAAGTLGQRVRALQAQVAQFETQISLQRERVARAERSVTRQQALVAAHFVSEAAAQQKEEELIDQRGQLAALERNASSLVGDLAAARQDLAASSLRRSNNASALERQVSELDQQLTEADTRRSIVLTAPADGIVTTLLTDPGQVAAPTTPLLSILPAGAALEAQLLVPTRAAGFIRDGQAVALRYQAFPYQRFGHHEGQVVQVGRSVIQPNEVSMPIVAQEPVYRVTVRLPAQQVQAYGQAMPLRAGMLLDADVAIDRRSIVAWLFEPLLSVTGRI
jgi:membrane fusion protein